MCVVFSSCFFFKQKTAYEMRISDWSSDVCSSDLVEADAGEDRLAVAAGADQRAERRGADVDHRGGFGAGQDRAQRQRQFDPPQPRARRQADRGRGPDRKSGGSGKSVAVRVDLGGRRVIKKKKKQNKQTKQK